MEAAFTKFRTVIAIVAMIVVAAATMQTVAPASGERARMPSRDLPAAVLEGRSRGAATAAPPSSSGRREAPRSAIRACSAGRTAPLRSSSSRPSRTSVRASAVRPARSCTSARSRRAPLRRSTSSVPSAIDRASRPSRTALRGWPVADKRTRRDAPPPDVRLDVAGDRDRRGFAPRGGPRRVGSARSSATSPSRARK